MIDILYEDNHLLVVKKPQNIPTQEDSSADKDMLNMCKEYIKTTYNKQGNVYLGLVHRLDRPTGGILVFAKTSKSASRLSEAFRNNEVEKYYLAVTVGIPRDNSGKLINYLKKDSKNNKVSVVPQLEEDAKYAELDYKVLEKSEKFALLEIKLKTGRSHQIRVQLSNNKTPVFGDVKYGGGVKDHNTLSLWAYKVRFLHPVTKQILTFICGPEEDMSPWKYFNIEKLLSI